ncbi:DMT family transporter [Stappia stellulata]|uniref:DMT family transporter n=1 Tax=Stappia stellulata TaxID=71235 RepID=UPI001CD36DEE|nr:DMT family transporter [Stappia stellulata]MCA1242507.1 DMT family transporter [Stappia stellulata]
MSSTPAAASGDLNSHNPRLGIALKIGATLLFTAMVALVKLLEARYPVGEVIFARSFFGLIPVLVMVWWQGEGSSVFKTRRPLGHIGRALIGGSAMAMWFAALARLPLPDATAISFSAPLITVALAAVILREKVRFYRWTAVVVGFLGILIILSPHLGATAPTQGTTEGAMLAFAAAVAMALAMITVRRLTNTERTSTIVIWFTGVMALLSLASAPFGWTVPTGTDALMLISIGLFGGIGQILLTTSYRFADASTIAPFDYTTMIWTVIVGWLVFSEVPTLEVMAGAIIVIGAGVFVIYRERQLGLDRSKERQTVTPSKV